MNLLVKLKIHDVDDKITNHPRKLTDEVQYGHQGTLPFLMMKVIQLPVGCEDTKRCLESWTCTT